MALTTALTLTRRFAATTDAALKEKGLTRHSEAMDAAWECVRDELIAAGVPERHLRHCMVQFFQH